MDYNVTYREKNGTVQAIISYKDSTGRWKQKSKQGFKTQKAAKPWIEDAIQELEDSIKFIDPVFNNITLNELFKMYLEHAELYIEQNSLRVFTNVENHFEKLLDLQARKITSIEVQECVDDLVKKKLNPSSISEYTAKLKVVFNYAVDHKIIKNNPTNNIKIPKDKTIQQEKIKALNKTEVNELLSIIKNKKHYLISLIAATCGLRFGEILGLTWDCINEKDSTMTINKQWKLIKRKPMEFGFGTVKSRNSNRIVPIPSKTMHELKEYKKQNPIDISNRLFPYKNIFGSNSSLNSVYKKLGFNISIHDLRHTYATTLVASGLDFKTIAELLGHSVNMTIKTYSHFTTDMMTKAKNVVNLIF
jgi:integrase